MHMHLILKECKHDLRSLMIYGYVEVATMCCFCFLFLFFYMPVVGQSSHAHALDPKRINVNMI